MDAGALNPPWWRHDGADIVLAVLVQPCARREALGPVVGDRIKIHLTAPPVDGAANDALQAFLAKQFGVAKNRVTLERGATGRRKQVRIAAVAALPVVFTALIKGEG